MKDVIQYPQFEALDLRVGEVVSAIAPEWSEKLLEMQVNFGEEIGVKTICSGIRQWYQPEDVVGKKYIFVANLAERKMGPSKSQGMMIMADTDERPTIIPVPAQIEAGTVVR
jgi:methionyl-tRNA synthetase